jgi:hypothetical protein
MIETKIDQVTNSNEVDKFLFYKRAAQRRRRATSQLVYSLHLALAGCQRSFQSHHARTEGSRASLRFAACCLCLRRTGHGDQHLPRPTTITCTNVWSTASSHWIIMENTAPSGCECCSLTSSKHSLPSEENRDSCFLLSLARSLAPLLLTSPRRYHRAPPNPSLALCLAAKSVADLAPPPPSLDPAATVLCPQRRAVLTPPPPCSARSKVDLPLPSSLLLSPCP